MEISIFQDKEYLITGINEINLEKKPFDIVIRFGTKFENKMSFVQFSKSDRFYKGLAAKKSIGEILASLYPKMDKNLLNQAFLSGGMSGALDPGNDSNLFFTSDYSNIWMYLSDENHYRFNSIEQKDDYIEARYRIENFDSGQGIQPLHEYPDGELYISFIYPESNSTTYNRELTKSVKLVF